MSVDNPCDHYRDLIAPATFGKHWIFNPGDSLYSATRSVRLVMQLDGNLVLYVLDSGILPPPLRVYGYPSCAGQGAGFLGDYGPITGAAADYLVQLSKETNPNNPYKSALWSSRTNGLGQFAHADFQDDGNLVVYDQQNVPHFASKTPGQQGAVLRCQDDGNLVIYDRNWNPIWASGTNVQTNLNDTRGEL